MRRAMTKVAIIGGLLALLALVLVRFWHRPDVTQAEAAPAVAAVSSASDGVSYEGRPLNSWIEQLKSEDEETRHEAATALIAMGEPSYSALAQFLNSPYKPDDRQNVALNRAVASFAELGPSAVPALLAAIRLEGSVDLRHNGGIAALLKMGPTAFPALEKALQDSDKEVRASALVALRFFGMSGATSPTLTSALITVLKDDAVPGLRAEAAMALGSSRTPSKEVTSALVEALADEDEVVRVQAASGLAASGVWTGTPAPEAAAGLPALIQALESEDPGVRFEAAMSLGVLGPAARPAIPALTLLLKDSEMGEWAAEALGAIGGEAITELQKAANGADRTARNNAAEVLGRLGYQGATSASALLADLKSPDPEVRKAAAFSIQSTVPDDPRVVPALIAALNDEDQYVRQRAAYALTSYGPKAEAAVPALMGMLSDDAMPAMAAIAALGAIGPAARPAIPALRAAMARERFNRAGQALAKMGSAGLAALTAGLKDSNKDVRSQAMDGLYHLGADAEPAMPSLIAALDDQEAGIRNFAAQTLGAIGPAAQPAVPKLIGRLQDKDGNVRAWAAHALGRIRPEAASAVQALAVAIGDSDEGARWEVAQALVLLGAGEKAVPALLQVANDRKGFMRINALALLRRIGPAARDSAGPLESLLNDTTESPFVRLASAAALTSVDPSNASGSSFLAESLTNPNEQVRLAAAAGLVELHIADTGTATALRPLLRSEDKQTAVTAARLLAVVNPNEQAALDFLSNALREEDGQVSFAAAKALAYMGVANPTSLQILISCLQNPALGWGTQRQSALALGKLGPAARSALPALGKLLTGSREPPLRQAAAAAIKQIRGERSVSYGEEDSAPALFDELVTGGGMRGLMGLR